MIDSSRNMRPTFIVIGAMKCGTTSLYYYLDAHPQIGMSVQKETDYFLGGENFEKGRDWYESRFRGGRSARGECSPNYTKRHLFSGVAQRMKELVPDVQLIYMVRDPIDRIISHYIGNRVHGREDRFFADAVTPLEESNYVLTSRYAFQLEPYLEHFGAGQILIRSLEELQSDPATVLSDIHRFVGVEEREDRDIRHTRFNTSRKKRLRGLWYRWFSSLLSQPVKDTLRPYIPKHWIPGAEIERPAPSPHLRSALSEAISEDVSFLRDFTGRSFDHWSV